MRKATKQHYLLCVRRACDQTIKTEYSIQYRLRSTAIHVHVCINRLRHDSICHSNSNAKIEQNHRVLYLGSISLAHRDNSRSVVVCICIRPNLKYTKRLIIFRCVCVAGKICFLFNEKKVASNNHQIRFCISISMCIILLLRPLLWYIYILSWIPSWINWIARASVYQALDMIYLSQEKLQPERTK